MFREVAKLAQVAIAREAFYVEQSCADLLDVSVAIEDIKQDPPTDGPARLLE